MKTLICLLALFVLISCRKNKIEYSRIIIADKEIMDVEDHTMYISGTIDKPKYIRLDFDRDGIYDLRFESTASVSMGQGVLPILSVESLHDGCELFVESFIDSVYFYETTQVQPDPNGTTASIHLTRYSCSKDSPSYTSDSVSKTQSVVPLIVGDRLDLTHDFESGRFYLAGPNQQSESQAQTINDTTYYEVTTYKSVCRQFPAHDVYFIGLRLQTADGPKLGWVKMQYLGDQAMRILEWALQK